jgi:hypothetical protein
MNRLPALVRSQDPSRFLQWDVVNEQMFVSNAEYVEHELRYLKGLPDWGLRWRPAVRESSLGAPTPLWKFPASSGNLVHHAYHLARFEEATRVDIGRLATIVEFGGGYGSLCCLAHRLAFRGRYILFDLPPFAGLQRFYLAGLGLRVIDQGTPGQTEHGILCLIDLGELDNALAGVTNLNRSIWCLSETPVFVRQRVLVSVERFGCFLFAYGRDFGEVDKVRFFQDWSRSRTAVRWRLEPIAHMAGQSSYLFGSRQQE